MVYKKSKKSYTKKAPVQQSTMQKVGDMAFKAFSMASKVAGIINSEKKVYDNHYLPTTINPNTPIIRHVSEIQQGTAVNQREGESVALKLLFTRMVIQWPEGTTNKSSMVRRIVLIDHNANNGTAPTISQVLEDPTTPLTRMMSPLNQNAFGRFKILLDRIYTRDVNISVVEKEDIHVFKNKKDQQGNRTISQKITWWGAGGGDTEKGHIYEILMTYDTGTEHPSLSGFTRIRYYDN